MVKRIAIFASGRGSNAAKIIDFFDKNPNIQVSLIVSNKAHAAVLNLADDRQIPSYVVSKQQFYESDACLLVLQKHQIDLVVLAGFLWLIPSNLIAHFPQKIVNIHPALLPNYGGKGMYGMYVHRAVKAAGENESGMTIHYVNEKYDEGGIIFQAKCPILSTDSAEDIAQKVLRLEHRHYAPVIEKILQQTE